MERKMQTIRTRLRKMTEQLTASERKIAQAILADYPFSGLLPIQELADRTGVSSASITRFVGKIGGGGYQDFQRQLIGELKEGNKSPLDLKVRQAPAEPAFLVDYANRMTVILREMTETVSQEQFDQVCRLIADTSRNVFLLGGRVSNTLASFLSIHLRQIRSQIYHLPDNPEFWPEHILRMRKKDIVVLFDFRRYQPNLAALAEMISRKRQATIILITDKWMSPIARHSSEIIALPIDAGTAWDTVVGAHVFVEALIVKVSEFDWASTQARIKAWDEVRLDSPMPGEEPSSTIDLEGTNEA
ncbi:MurR/RpiR family transcriptional regulator [Ciceribacter thiooxidans]|uniref:MurR/RpiR family transcriptional regulator n=1 Tax=Ciceribacter thiooxidans TaxID=1969821 RepID=A0ABV7I9X8_9HYPH|nr:MurR/RpiR family transcriptional regulator [Ciceribacter thiooxidans]